jgi:hypothetical protein
MTNDLLAKATALLAQVSDMQKARKRLDDLGDYRRSAYQNGYRDALIVDAPIVAGYQDLVRRMADTLQLAGGALEDCMVSHVPGQDFAETVKTSSKRQRIIASQESISKVLAEARAAITHTPTNS